MANKRAGETLQQAIAEGRAKQCTAVCKATGERCNRVARTGYDVCSSHGAGTRKREIAGIRHRPGRPAEHGIYARSIPEEYKEAYEQVFGDLTLVHEVALVKTLLLRWLDKMNVNLQICESEDESSMTVNSVIQRAQDKDNIHYLIKLLDMATRTTTAAYEQLKGKKITVQVQQSQTDMLDIIREAVAEEVSFINGILCVDCRQRVADALNERQQTVLEH